MKTYNFKKVILTWGPYRIRGFMPDSEIQVELDEDTFTKETGADGEVARSQSNAEGGVVTVMLQQTSPSNDDLSEAALLDRKNGDEVWPLQIDDLNGNSLVFAEEAWIMKPANGTWGKAYTGREWRFDCAQMTEYHIGGQN